MPTYCRKCLKCQHSFETFAKLSESALIRCPQCGGPVVTDVQAQGAPRTPGMVPLPTKAQTLHEEFVPPRQVEEAKRLFGPDLQHCFKPNGDVVVPDSRTAKAYFARKEALKRVGAEKYEEKQAKQST